MGSVNKVVLVGHLGRDPEVRTPHGIAGDKIVTLNIATSEQWKDRSSGERKEKTEWHRVAIFNPNLADVAERYLKKGSLVYVEGALQTRKWTDQHGVEKYSTEIVIGRFKGELTLLGGNGSRGPDNEHDGYGSQRPRHAPRGDGFAGTDATGRSIPSGGGGMGETNFGDDEIPFAVPADLPIGRRVP